MELLFIYATISLGVGTVMYQQRLNQNKSVTANDFHQSQQPTLSAALPSTRKYICTQLNFINFIFKAEELKKTPFILYRYTTCPFCGKVKAFLDYYQIPYSLVEVEPMFKREVAYGIVMPSIDSFIRLITVEGSSILKGPSVAGTIEFKRINFIPLLII